MAFRYFVHGPMCFGSQIDRRSDRLGIFAHNDSIPLFCRHIKQQRGPPYPRLKNGGYAAALSSTLAYRRFCQLVGQSGQFDTVQRGEYTRGSGRSRRFVASATGLPSILRFAS